jgi:hypothetical protein
MSASVTVGAIGMKQQIRVVGYGIATFALAAVAALASAAGMYKWVDDQGVVHYSDQVPPAKGATVLDKQGRQVKKIEPPLSPEQQKAQAEEEERQRALTKARDDQARKDRALMASYTSEGEIDIAKARSISTIDAQIKSAQAYSADLTRRQQEIAAKKASYGSKPIPVELEHESAAVDSELSRQAVLIRQKQGELDLAVTKYDTIKQRWHEIVADQERAAAAADAQPTTKAGKGGTTKPATAAPQPASAAANK